MGVRGRKNKREKREGGTPDVERGCTPWRGLCWLSTSATGPFRGRKRIRRKDKGAGRRRDGEREGSKVRVSIMKWMPRGCELLGGTNEECETHSQINLTYSLTLTTYHCNSGAPLIPLPPHSSQDPVQRSPSSRFDELVRLATLRLLLSSRLYSIAPFVRIIARTHCQSGLVGRIGADDTTNDTVAVYRCHDRQRQGTIRRCSVT